MAATQFAKSISADWSVGSRQTNENSHQIAGPT